LADAQTKRVNANLHVGTMGWSYAFWKGVFYPEKLASKKFLAYYAQKLGTVEVDSTFYRIPSEFTIAEWKTQTPAGFVFSLKFPQVITHVKMLKDCQRETQVFLERVDLLGEKLGALLLQFPPMFRQQHLPQLREYLEALPMGRRYAVEVRNKSLLNESLYALLKEHGVALAWVDAAKMPQVSEVTADFVYVRWEGDRKTVTGTLGKVEIDRAISIKTWAMKLKPVLAEGTEVFGYFSKYYSGYPLSNVDAFLKEVSSV
jgi:uncharacterized protein YecE (DUF72 family)